MCGIIGYIGSQRAAPILHRGLQNLEYRGYDSAGLALVYGELSITKERGEVSALPVPEHAEATFGLGHTRWSTHGPPTETNAHPHVDCTGGIAVVHNGIIDNHETLRAELSDHTFVSETDTEVIPHLLEEAVDEGLDLRGAVERVADRLEGSFAFCAAMVDEDCIVGTRQGSPLVLGHGEDGAFVASDVPAFLEYTDEVTFLEDGQIAVLDRGGIEVFENGAACEVAVETVDWDAEDAEKGGYEHYMRKEIHEQPRALRQAISDRLDRGAGEADLELDFPRGYLDSLQEIHLVAAGTSSYAATFGARLLERELDVRARAYVASEYEFGRGSDPWRTLVIAVTQSGETKDTIDAIEKAVGAGARTLSVTNVHGSSITRTTDETVYIRAGPEIAVASTKAFSGQAVALAMLVVELGRARGDMTASAGRELLDELSELPGAVQQVLDREDLVQAAAARHADASAFFFIARRLGYPVALEGALKLKEISYAHAEGFPAGELKHGPLALVQEDTPVIALLTHGSEPGKTVHNVREAQTRGAPTIGLSSGEMDGTDERWPVAEVGRCEPIVANVYLQLFAYHVAKELDRPIDKPRNLAKSVTVE